MDLGIQPEFYYKLVAYKGDEKFEFEGEGCLKQFGEFDKSGMTSLGWADGDDEFIFANLVDGSFDLKGFNLKIDLGLLGNDENGNVKAVTIKELTLEPIWFRRVRQDFAPDGIKTTVKYCVGWKAKYDGRVSQKIAMLDEETGEITLSDRK